MTTIIPYFDPILGKLRNSDVALISLATLVVTDPLIVNNLQVLSTASINQLHTNAIYNVSTISTNGLGLNYAQWNSNTSLGPLEGLMNWSSLYGTIQLGLAGGNVDVPLGLTTNLPKRVRNSTGSTMAKGTAVYLNGVSGNTPTVERAIANNDMSSAFTIGMTAEDIANNGTGWVTSFGLIRGVNTSSFTSGDTLYLSGATAGYYTNVPTKAPTHYVRVGTVTKASADGEIIVNIINGYELDELHNVIIASLASGQILQSGVSSYWYNRSLASAVADFISIPSIPSLGSLAVMNQLSFTSLTNQPSLSSLAFQSTIDYTSAQLTNKPSLGSLAVLNSLTKSDVGLGNVTNDAQLKIASNLSDLNNVATARGNLSLGSMAVANTVNGFLPSTASFNLLYTNGIANNSTVSTNRLSTNQLFASTATIGNLTLNNLSVSSNVSVQLLNASKVGIGISDPVYPLSVNGTIYSSDQIQAMGQIFGNDISSTTTIDAGSNITAGGYISASGDVFGANLSGTNTGDQIMPVYGDGSDGFVNFNGVNTFTFATYDGGSTTYTLTRDVFAYSVDVALGITLITAGYRVFSQTYISNYGLIHNKGANGSGTTGGAGGLGGFFKAGGAGANGLGTASAGANGTAQATPTANTLVGGIGGKGAMGRAGTTTFTGGMITSANVTVPADADGGNKVQSNYINYLTRYIVGATNWQMTPSIGGGSGAKSIIGTTATSGGGGGGGGIIFLASPIIDGTGTISADGGAGGNASGTGGNFGGGGGGGGGIACVIAKTSAITPTASGGAGGTSVIGTNGTLPVAIANGTTTTATQTMTLIPTVLLTKGNLYMVTFHLQITGGIGGSGINSMSGFGMSWTNLNTRVEFNSIASPTRVIETWYGYYTGTEPDIIDDKTITVNLSNLNTTARVIIDEIQNTDASFSINPITANTATNRVDSATTLTVTLPNAPTAGNLVYSVFGRSAGTVPTAGAGNTIVNSQTTAPQLVSQVSSAQQANTQTHTTASAVAGISVEITKSTAGKNGGNGWDGKVVRIYG